MDPNPIKHIGSLTYRVRAEVESALLRAGFVYDGKQTPQPRCVRLNYSRRDMLICVYLDPIHMRLSADAMDDRDGTRSIANVNLEEPRTTEQLMNNIDQFCAAVNDCVSDLPAPTAP